MKTAQKQRNLKKVWLNLPTWPKTGLNIMSSTRLIEAIFLIYLWTMSKHLSQSMTYFSQRRRQRTLWKMLMPWEIVQTPLSFRTHPSLLKQYQRSQTSKTKWAIIDFCKAVSRRWRQPKDLATRATSQVSCRRLTATKARTWWNRCKMLASPWTTVL